ncbi:AAA family ATPase [Chloroflexota bacterium]
MLDFKQIIETQQSSHIEGVITPEPEISLQRYVIRNASYALSPHPPIEWIVEQLISEGSVSLFYGDPGSKKTYALLSLAVCVALGKSWLGFLVNQCKVLLIDEESGERRLSLRLAAAIRGELGDENTPVEFVSLAGFLLDNKVDQKELLELIKTSSAKLVIIDALTDVMDGDENSKQDTQPVFTALRRIAETTKAAIIVIHHSNKQGGYRGSSAIKGALDLMVKIESEEGSHLISFTSEKTRDIEAVRFAGEATWMEDQFYLTEFGLSDKPKKRNKSKKYVIRYLLEHGASPLQTIMDASDSCSSNAARQAVYALVEDGEVYRTNPNESGRGVKALYDLIKNKDENE